MQKLNIITTIILLGMCGSTFAQKDTVLTRDVTVEREFKPIIQQAGKINQRPQSSTTQPPTAAKVEFSTYVNDLQPDYNINSLLSQPTRFHKPDPLHGYLRAAIGHPQTMLDFGYIREDKKNILKLYVEHEAEWGLKAMEETAIGADFRHLYSTGSVYIKLKGANEFFTRYGRYYLDEKNPNMNAWKNGLEAEGFGALTAKDKQNIWKFDITLGTQSNTKQEFQYLVEAGYKAYSVTNIVTEHQANVRFNMGYSINEENRIGVNLYSQNQFMSVSDSARSEVDAAGTYNSRHALRMEPYYEYLGRRILLHIGANMDMNIGKGNLLSGTSDATPLQRQLAFAPSPNVHFEAQLAPRWAIFYVDAQGSLGTSSINSYMNLNRYQTLTTAIVSHHVSSYSPIDSELGFRFRPHRDLLLSVHAGYAYRLNQAFFAHDGDFFRFVYTDFQQWKIGAQVAYHYRDIVDLHIWGDYFIYSGVKNNTTNNTKYATSTSGRIYDRPDWEIGFEVIGRIDKHWSVYTHSQMEGARWAYTLQHGDKRLPAFINIDLGCGYQFAQTGNKALDRLYLFAELQNLLHRQNQIWYGYQTEGLHGRIGLSWKF